MTMKNQQISILERILLVIFSLCLIHSFWAIGAGWNNPLIDEHSFRQTQTAISVFYLLKGGPWLAYETPIFGFPWSIPMEFPLYQGIVALLAQVFPAPLDQTGRFVSAFFFYASLLPLYGVLYYLGIARVYRWIFLSLFLASPLYLFWSRTFLIESTALFFCIAYSFWIALYFRKNYPIYALIFASICGIAGGLTKATTFAVFLLLSVLWIGINFLEKKDLNNILKRIILPLAAFCILPVLATKLWVSFSDGQKLLNPMTSDFLISSSLHDWNFGTISQKLSRSEWRKYLQRTGDDVFGNAILMIIVLCILPFFTKYKRFIFSSIALFLIVPIIFTNLHFIHNYYAYANAIFLLVAAGFTVTGFVDKSQKIGKYAGLSILIAILISQFYFYQNVWYPKATFYGKASLEVARETQKLTSERGVVVIFSQDWNATIPYYSQRRSLMVFNRDKEKKFEFGMAKLAAANYRVEAMLFCGRYRQGIERKQGFLRQYRFDETASFANKRCEIYLPVDAVR
jgi:hypothetical protein